MAQYVKLSSDLHIHNARPPPPHSYTHLKHILAGEMAWQLRAFADLADNPGSVPSTLRAIHNCL